MLHVPQNIRCYYAFVHVHKKNHQGKKFTGQNKESQGLSGTVSLDDGS